HVLKSNGWIIHEVWNRTPVHTARLAAALGAGVAGELAAMDQGADIYIIAVTDTALPAVAAQLRVNQGLVVHTAGTVARDILKDCSAAYGVFWPIKMIRAGMTSLQPFTAAIDASGREAMAGLQLLGTALGAEMVAADDALRKKLHLLAAITANFSNHLYTLAADYCRDAGIDFSLLHPIIQDTAQRLSERAPGLNQAGPAFRGDFVTLAQHRELLKNYPALLTIYELLSADIYRYYHPELTGV
ncbi:MAG TPA: DUF2520 domain-containing protein, partial [Sediminibacterium sp.]|nr:DUF2520 domain-containing protein [Sediminibacterium sp.]